MNRNIPYELLSNYFSGECTPEEEQRLSEWIEADASHKDIFESLRAIWVEAAKGGKEFDVNALWEKVAARSRIVTEKSEDVSIQRQWSYRDKLAKRTSRRTREVFTFALRIAAVILIFIGAPYLIFYTPTDQEISSQISVTRVVSTEKGERAQFRFTDGTRVWLNSGSTIRFTAPFSADARELYLEGEAYFEVAHNERMPFIVHTADAAVRVLGTEFNVRARGEEEQMEVVVIDGKVMLEKENDAESEGVLLTKGLMSGLSREGVLTPPRHVDTEIYTAWVRGRLIFDRLPLAQVLRELERWYDLQCRLEGSAAELASARVTASFTTETLDEVLRSIVMTTNLRYERDGKHVVFF